MNADLGDGATSGVGVLASYAYDNLGARTAVAYGNGTSRSYGYDPLSRLGSMSLTGLAPASANLTINNITYNAASQIVSQVAGELESVQMPSMSARKLSNVTVGGQT